MPTIHRSPSVFLTTADVADRWRISPRTLEGWRDKGIGPSYVKIGSRVRYRIDHIELCEQTWNISD